MIAPLDFPENQINPHMLLVCLGLFAIQNVGPQYDGDNSKVKVKVRVNVHGIFSVANASVIEKQNVEGDHSDVPMDAESSCKNQGKDDELVRKTSPCNCNKRTENQRLNRS